MINSYFKNLGIIFLSFFVMSSVIISCSPPTTTEIKKTNFSIKADDTSKQITMSDLFNNLKESRDNQNLDLQVTKSYLNDDLFFKDSRKSVVYDYNTNVFTYQNIFYISKEDYLTQNFSRRNMSFGIGKRGNNTYIILFNLSEAKYGISPISTDYEDFVSHIILNDEILKFPHTKIVNNANLTLNSNNSDLSSYVNYYKDNLNHSYSYQSVDKKFNLVDIFRGEYFASSKLTLDRQDNDLLVSYTGITTSSGFAYYKDSEICFCDSASSPIPRVNEEIIFKIKNVFNDIKITLDKKELTLANDVTNISVEVPEKDKDRQYTLKVVPPATTPLSCDNIEIPKISLEPQTFTGNQQNIKFPPQGKTIDETVNGEYKVEFYFNDKPSEITRKSIQVNRKRNIAANILSDNGIVKDGSFYFILNSGSNISTNINVIPESKKIPYKITTDVIPSINKCYLGDQIVSGDLTINTGLGSHNVDISYVDQSGTESKTITLTDSEPPTNPSGDPSSNPSNNPSSNPSGSSQPSNNPSSDPSSNPSNNPSSDPSSNPSNNPNPRFTPDPNRTPKPSPTQKPNPNPTPTPSSCNIVSPEVKDLLTNLPEITNESMIDINAFENNIASLENQGDFSFSTSANTNKINNLKIKANSKYFDVLDDLSYLQQKIDTLSAYINSKYGYIPQIPNSSFEYMNQTINNLALKFSNSKKDYLLSDELFVLFDEMRLYKAYSENFINIARSGQSTIDSLKVLKNNIKSHVNFISKKLGLLEDLDEQLQNDGNSLLNTSNSILDKIEPLELSSNDSFTIQFSSGEIADINNLLSNLKGKSREILSKTKAIEKKALLREMKSLGKSLVTKIARNTIIGSSGAVVGVYLSLVVDIYDAVDIGTSVCESLYKQYNISSTLYRIQALADIAVPIIEAIKEDRCLRNTSTADLQKEIDKLLIGGFNQVTESLKTYMSNINQTERNEANITNSKNILDARINGYQTNTSVNAKSKVNSECQDDPNESDCIKVARKTFNTNGRKPVLLKGPAPCLVYRSGKTRKYFSLTPREVDINSGLSTNLTLLESISFIKGKDGKGKGVSYFIEVTSLLNPLVAVLDGNKHVSIRASKPYKSTTIDTVLMTEWSVTRDILNNIPFNKLKPDEPDARNNSHELTLKLYDNSVIGSFNVE